MKHRKLRKQHGSRKLTEEEVKEEEFYRTQLIGAWGWRDGKSPDDIIRKKKEEL